MQAVEAAPPPEAVARPAVAIRALTFAAAKADDRRSLEEMIFDASRAALDQIGKRASEIDSIVLFGDDQMNGRVISCMVGNGPAGGVDRDVTMLPSSGEHAFIYAYLRLLAGQGKDVLVVGWGKPSEGNSPEYAELMTAEPYFLRQVGMNYTIAAALHASKYTTEAREGQIAAWPLTEQDLPSSADVVHAVVLAVEDSFEPGGELGWILGAGWATDVYDLGARDVSEVPALAAALRQLEDRGVPGPSEWDALEIAAGSEVAVGVLAGRLGLKGGTRVNASGSTAEFPGASSTSGLGRVLKAVDGLGSGPENAVAAGIGLQGFAGQGAAVVVFGKRRASDG